MSLMGNVIETVRSTGSDYWAAYVGGEKIKTNGPEPMTWLYIVIDKEEVENVLDSLAPS